MKVVDLGCGTGRHTARLAEAGARVTALDFSESMLAVARQKPQCVGVKFIVHDLNLPLPLDNGSCDRVVCGLVLEHLRDVPEFFREMRRIGSDDGAAIVSVMHPAMWLAGVQARFTEPASGNKVLVASERHTISEYVMAALGADWRIDHISEHAVDESLARQMPKAARYLGWPMLLMMRLR
jgi:malonyl-CoA O-methyltransferase